ncbi:MAG TPA: hypothetical protein VK104_04975 [Burkholderiaceae bacterium]|nr:hypothetical protein [Burkholderiaceae bacterium]
MKTTCSHLPSTGRRLVRSLAAMAVSALALSAAAPVLAADDNQSGSQAVSELQVMSWASACITCHGGAERVQGSGITALAGTDAETMMEKLDNMAVSDKSGALMVQLVRGYDRDVLQAIAQWYEQQ